MTKAAFFSTDWSFQRQPDPAQSLKAGRTVYKPGAIATFGGTYYYRMFMPAVELAKHGWDTVLAWRLVEGPNGEMVVQDTAGDWHDDCDIVVIQRWMHEDGAERCRKAQACGQIVVNDIDDHYWALPKSNLAHSTTDPTKNATFNRAHYKAMIAASDAVTCSTPVLASYLNGLAPTVVVRNAVDTDRFAQQDPTTGMVGWVGGVAWRGQDLTLLSQWLPRFLEDHKLPFYHGGHNPDGETTAWEQAGIDVSKINVAFNDLCSLDEYPRLWEPLAVSLIPLERSTFNLSKSWLKGLESAACGLPFIATRMPEYERLGCGRLASSPREWRRHLTDLLDPDVRVAEGAANRLRAEELSIDKQWVRWDEVYRALLSAGPVGPHSLGSADVTGAPQPPTREFEEAS